MAIDPENDLTKLIISYVQQTWPDMQISVHLLEHPTSEFVIEFYQRFQQTMKDTLSRMVNTAAEAADAPKANEESIFSILRFVNKYLKESLHNPADADGMSLTLTDIYEPTAKRTRVRFTVLLNLLLYFSDKIPQVRDFVTKRLEKAQAYTNKLEMKEALKEKLAGEAESLASLNDKLNKLQKEEEKANLRYNNLQKQKSENDMHHLKLQKELPEIVTNCENKHTLLTNVKANIEHLNEQIIREEDFKTLVDLKENLVKRCAELDTEIECLGEILGKRRPEVERFDNINKQLITLKNASEELRLSQKSVLSASTQLQLCVEYYEKSSEESKARTENILKYEESTKAIPEALQSTTVKNNTVKVQMQQELEQLKSELNEEQKHQNDALLEKDTLQGQIAATKTEIEEIELKIEELNLSFADQYKNMLSMENASTSKFHATLEGIRDALLQAQGHENSETSSTD